MGGKISSMMVKVVSLGVLVAGLGLGGCKNVSRDQYELAVQESQALRTENATLAESSRAKDSQIASLQQQLSTAQMAAQAPAPAAPAGGNNNWGSTDTGGTRSRGSSAETYTLGDVAFGAGQAVLSSAAKRELDGVARDIARRHAGAQIRVEGHTDSTPIRKSKWGSNEALSQARADAVREYLITKGIASGRIDSMGFGSSRPKGSAAASRRVEIVVLN
jgi:chemotaxis protein MotB